MAKGIGVRGIWWVLVVSVLAMAGGGCDLEIPESDVEDSGPQDEEQAQLPEPLNPPPVTEAGQPPGAEGESEDADEPAAPPRSETTTAESPPTEGSNAGESNAGETEGESTAVAEAEAPTGPDESGPERSDTCTSAEDCPQPSSPCVERACIYEPRQGEWVGECVFVASTDGAPCDSQSPCSAVGECMRGDCVATALDCSDDDPCTFDACVDGACEHWPDADCEPAECASDADCDDANACTEDVCALGVCESIVAGQDELIVCDDGDVCTLADLCFGAECSGEPITCDDGEPCTEDACDAATGVCVYEWNSAGIACSAAPIEPAEVPAVALPWWAALEPGDPCPVETPGKEMTPDYPGVVLCVFPPTEEAGPHDADGLACPIQVARAAGVTLNPSALQASFRFDQQQLSLEQITSAMCFDGIGCMDVEVALSEGTSWPLPTGHNLVTAPDSAAGWNVHGFGVMLVQNFSEPDAPLVENSVWDDGEVSGNPEIFRLIFSAAADADPTAPGLVCAQSLFTTNSASQNTLVQIMPPGVIVNFGPQQ